ncbi:MAG: glycosyltransferase family 9 protein [Candidatus Binatia bacterium]
MLKVAVRGELCDLVSRLRFGCGVSSLDSRLFAQLFSLSATVSEEVSRFFSCITEVYSWFGHSQPEVGANLHLLVPWRVHSWAFFSGQEDCHVSTYYLHCVGIDEQRCPSLLLEKEERVWLDCYWKYWERRPSPRVLVMHPGSGGQKKRWASEGFIQVARWWREDKKGEVLILLGPAEEQEESRWQRIGKVEKNLSLWQAAALLSRADLYIGNDSGISHLAGAVGARGVVVFGPTRTRQWRPLGGRLSVIQNVSYRAAMPDVPGISLAEVSWEQILAALVCQGGCGQLS